MSEEKGIFVAACTGDLNRVKFLLENGADVNTKSVQGYTLLHAATFYEHIEIVRLLLKYRANINAEIYCGETALQMATRKGYYGIATIIRAEKWKIRGEKWKRFFRRLGSLRTKSR